MCRLFQLVHLAGVLVLAFVAACRPANPSYRVVESGSMAFEDLFVPVDTVRIDASVLIGYMGFVDVSREGDFLVTDEMNRAFHVFGPAGKHVRTFSSKQCNPEEGARSSSGRFLADGRMVVATSTGTFVFDADGNCETRIPNIPIARPSFCGRRDTVYIFLPRFRPPKIHAYAVESGTARHYDLREPAFPRVTQVKMGLWGRQIACFDHGVYYRYPESSDAEPLWTGGDEVVMHRPPFFRAPQRDLGEATGRARIDDLRELSREATYSSGIFELDENHRLVTYQPRSGETKFIVVNTQTQTSVSTWTDQNITLAKDGLLYVQLDYEELPSGEMGNKMLGVLRFIPFEPSGTKSTP